MHYIVRNIERNYLTNSYKMYAISHHYDKKRVYIFEFTCYFEEITKI